MLVVSVQRLGSVVVVGSLGGGLAGWGIGSVVSSAFASDHCHARLQSGQALPPVCIVCGALRSTRESFRNLGKLSPDDTVDKVGTVDRLL